VFRGHLAGHPRVTDVRDGPVLRGESVMLRPVAIDDLPRLAAIIATPEVGRWWGSAFTADDIEGVEVVFAVEVNGEVAGLAQ
jgi:hypothetical protein